jgi:two-component system, OmpR family, response regulator
MLEEFLKLHNCKVCFAEDVVTAIRQVRVCRPDVVLTSLSLPGEDGCALCDRVRRERTLLDTPIIVLTAWADNVHLERARAAGGDVVLCKPYGLDALWQEIVSLVERGRRPRRTPRRVPGPVC